MFKYLYTLAIASLMGNATNCSENTKSHPIRTAAAVYAAGSISTAALGVLLQKSSGLPGTLSINPDKFAKGSLNIVDKFPADRYSPSLLRHYTTKAAHGLFVLSSGFSAPWRGLIFPPAKAALDTTDIIKNWHKAQDPQINWQSKYRLKQDIQNSKANLKNQLNPFKGPRYAILGFGVPYVASKVYDTSKAVQEVGAVGGTIISETVKHIVER